MAYEENARHKDPIYAYVGICGTSTNRLPSCRQKMPVYKYIDPIIIEYLENRLGIFINNYLIWLQGWFELTTHFGKRF